MKSFAKGDHGGYYKIADIGRAELIEVIEDMGVSAKRIPSWLLPDSCLKRADIDPAYSNRLRPDIMLVEMSQSECMSYRILSLAVSPETQPETPRALNNHDQPEQGRWLIGPQRRKYRKVWLIEGGYTSDTRHLTKLAEKETGTESW